MKSAYLEYVDRIERKHYKNVESALGNLYRAARDKKLTGKERDALIEYAKARYSDKKPKLETPIPKQPHVPRPKLKWRGKNEWAQTSTLEVPDVGTVEVVLKGKYAGAGGKGGTQLSFHLAEFFNRIIDINPEDICPIVLQKTARKK